MNRYYSEKIIKNTSYRKDYLDGISNFLEKAKENAQSERFGFMTPEKYKENPEKYYNTFVDMLGFPLRESREEKVTATKEFVATDRNVNIFRMQLSITGIKFYGIYFEQVEKKSDTPFVIALHGGEGTPELVGSIHNDSTNYNHLARRLTDRGCSVFCPQLMLWNLSMYGNEYNRDDIRSKLQMLGGSITALEVFLLSRSLDYFIEEEKVCAERIGVAGLSYGGQYSMDLAAYDRRIRVCSSHGFFNNRYIYSEPDWCYPNELRTICDAEKAGLICPRALQIQVGDKDDIFSFSPAIEESKRAKEFFGVYGVPEQFDFYCFDGAHETDKSDRWVEFFMEKI